MKLTSLLLSSAAVLVAGSAFAADLPAKKAAPAAAVTACPAFGGGFFTIPGSDTCIKFSGYVRDDMTFKSAADKTEAEGTSNENLYSAYSNSASFRLNIDTRSNTDIGVVRGFARINGSALKQAYVQAGGFTAGLAGTWMGNGGGVIAAQFGSHSDSTQISYSAAIGGGTVTLGILNAGDNDVISNRTSATSSSGGVASMPDLMATISVPVGGATLGLGVVSHETRGETSGSNAGYAVGATLGLAPAAGVTMGIEGGYASGALGYLGTSGVASGVAGDIYQVGDTDLNAGVVGDANTGYSVSGYASFAAGNGSVNLYAGYTVLSDETNTIDVTSSTFEIDYAMTVAKGLTITPAIAYISGDDGSTSENATVAVIRIQRDF